MAFDLLAFAGGFAESSMERMDKNEKEAKEFALASTKNMYKKYSDRLEEDKTLAKETADDMALIQSSYVNMAGGKSFTPEQLTQIASSPANRKALVEAIKTNSINFANINPEQMVKIVTTNSPAVAREKIDQAGKIDTVLREKLTDQNTFGQMYKGFYTKTAESAGKAIEDKTARAFGTTIEEMKTKLAEKRPEATAEFDFSGLRATKSYDKMKDEAQVAYLKAMKSGNPDDIKSTATDLAVYKAMEATVPTEQAKWLETKARLAATIVKGGPDAKAAQIERDKMVDVEAKEALRKHIKPAGEGEGKVPALGTLNSFVKDAGSRAVEMTHGKQLGRELSRTQMPDGTVSLQYIGDNPEFAKQVDDTRRAAALKALSLYPADNRDVQAILRTYEPVAAPKETPVPTAVAKPTLPVLQPKNAPTASAATAKPSIGQERATALDAIRQGANEAAVKKRFKETTGQDL